MRSKFLIFSVLASLSVVVLFAAAVAAFVFIGGDAVQAEEAVIQESIDVTPVEVEPVGHFETVKPDNTIERASYAGHEGGCPFGNAKMQLTEKAPAESEVVGEDLLTLAE